MAIEFYIKLYSDDAVAMNYILKNAFPHLDHGSTAMLDSPLTGREIKDSIFSMGKMKAPRIDGLQAIFYQSKWDLVRLDLCRLLFCIFEDLLKVVEIKKILIILILKVELATNLKQMRSISLCSVSYKAMTKILSTRLRKVMEHLVSPTQYSFVPGRHSSDNIIIHKEITTPRMRLLWNEEVLEKFAPSRAIGHGFWKPIRLKKDSLSLSHLFFVDDLILFVEANIQEDISEALQFTRMDDLEKYLGVPFTYCYLTTCNEIDRKCKNFLWGETDNTKNVYLLNWSEINKPKNSGGLGICHAKGLNHAFMMKAGWVLIERPDALRTKVLHSKYKWVVILYQKWKEKVVNLICGRAFAKHGVTWNVIQYGALEMGLESNSRNIDGCQPWIAWKIIQLSEWDGEKLKDSLSLGIVQKIMAMSPPSHWKNVDHVA
ncbi:uncharacterized protein [Arachis hypogaea]|uniref:uncharacterized protein n=1 Tax=Arachis hypogaea TaxID=3818 RepID=UPI003B21B75D